MKPLRRTRFVSVCLAAAGLVVLGGSLAYRYQHSRWQPLALHRQVITTEFWVGEPADNDNGHISNTGSTWDEQWQQHLGGVDNPLRRDGYKPTGVTLHENPFYFALPYSDLGGEGNRKPSAAFCLQASGNRPTPYSWCKNSWIAVTYKGKTVCAQWEDAGPFGENDTAYVFGTAAPANTQGAVAGLDVSPAVSTYLGLNGLNRTSWRFIRSRDVPAGPWKQLVTADPGELAN